MILWQDVSFGRSKAGLGTVGFRLYKSDGTDAAVRTTTGVVETAGGGYGALVTVAADTVGIEWDTGEGTPTFAHEDMVGRQEADNMHDSAFNRRVWDQSGNTITLYEDDGVTVLAVFDTVGQITEITPQ